jgi:hypothetical protein
MIPFQRQPSPPRADRKNQPTYKAIYIFARRFISSWKHLLTNVREWPALKIFTFWHQEKRQGRRTKTKELQFSRFDRIPSASTLREKLNWDLSDGFQLGSGFCIVKFLGSSL